MKLTDIQTDFLGCVLFESNRTNAFEHLWETCLFAFGTESVARDGSFAFEARINFFAFRLTRAHLVPFGALAIVGTLGIHTFHSRRLFHARVRCALI